MTDDEREDITAAIAAHDVMLQMILLNLSRLLSPAQRKAFVENVTKMPPLSLDVPARDFDSADRLAGVAQKTENHLKRLFRTVEEAGTSPGENS